MKINDFYLELHCKDLLNTESRSFLLMKRRRTVIWHIGERHGVSMRKIVQFDNGFNMMRDTCSSLVAAADIDGFVKDVCKVITRTPSAEAVAQGASGTVRTDRFIQWGQEKLSYNLDR